MSSSTEAEATVLPDADGGSRWRPQRLHRHRYSAEERRRLLDALFPSSGWVFRFSFMLALSIVIAVMGLGANSVAAVIGAMLIAPLMSPVMAMAAALAMQWGRRALGKAFTVALASALSIALSYVLALMVRTEPLTNAVLSRTSPDGRDFLIALAAGLAGAYATAREDVSVALPGVAVAVALVPPLGVIGITLEAGRTDLAGGALLLYTANLLTILFAGIIVFLLTGFVPMPRMARAAPRLFGTVLMTALAVALVALPLAIESSNAADRARLIERTNRAVFSWLEGAGDVEVEGVSVEGETVRVDLMGPGEPPDSLVLVESLRGVVGADADIQIRWRTVSTVNVDEAARPDPDETRAEIAEVVRPLVESWLAQGGLGEALDVVLVDVADLTGARIDVELAGDSLPPPVAPLAEAVSAALGRSVELQVLVSERAVFDPSTDPDPDREATLHRLDAAVRAWAQDEGVELFAAQLDPDRPPLTVDVIGSSPPGPSGELVRELRRIAERPRLEIEIRFIPRFAVPETTTTTTTSATSTSAVAADA